MKQTLKQTLKEEVETRLENRALLVTLSTGRPGASRRSRSGTAALADKFDADEKRIAALVRVIPAKFTDLYEKPMRKFREVMYAKCIAFGRNGERIVMADRYPELMELFREYKEKVDAGIAEFLAQYDAIVMAARNELGGLSNEAYYPAKADVARRFKFEMTASPLVMDEDVARIAGLGDAEIAQVKEDVRRTIEAGQQSAMMNIVDRFAKALYRVVSTMAANGGGRWRKSLIGNLADLADVAESFLPMLPEDGKDTIEKVIGLVRESMADWTPEEVKAAPELQRQFFNAGMDALDRLTAWTGQSADDMLAKEWE